MQRNFDFQAYVKRQKSPEHQDSIVYLQNYAFSEDMRRLRQFSEYRPVRSLIQGVQQVWTFREKPAYLRECEEITGGPMLSAWIDACLCFRIPRQKIFWRRNIHGAFEIMGNRKENIIAFHPNILQKTLPEAQFIIGQAIGALQNGHVPGLTLLAYGSKLTHGMGEIVFRQLDGALTGWQEDACITRDRAGLLLCRNVSIAMKGICAEYLDWDEDEMDDEIRRYQQGEEVDWENIRVAQRIQAIQVFALSRFYAELSTRFKWSEDVSWKMRPKRKYIPQKPSLSIRMANLIQNRLQISPQHKARTRMPAIPQNALKSMTEVDEMVLNMLENNRPEGSSPLFPFWS